VEQVGLIVLGSVIGAVATGGVGLYAERRRERLARKVAARLILGDLYLVEALADAAAEQRFWPSVEWGEPVETWRGSREAFAASVQAWEWAVVDNTFRSIGRVAGRADREERRGSKRISDEGVAEVERLSESARQARAIVLPHAADKREQAQLTQELARLAKAESERRRTE
jgi:hypothetical protein